MSEAAQLTEHGIELNQLYRSSRIGRHRDVYPVLVKKDKVTVKEDLNRADSKTLSLAEFRKYFALVK